jgi:gluconokinase
MILIIMGVAGSGKTTVGSLLADKLGWKFYDADDFHSESNREKMSRGTPLTDEDRFSWLTSLQGLIRSNLQSRTSLVLACSALKDSYRSMLKVNDQVRFVHLKGTYSQIEARLKNRTGHYMPVQLLASQFEALEEPQDALAVDITQSPEEIISIIRKGFTL